MTMLFVEILSNVMSDYFYPKLMNKFIEKGEGLLWLQQKG